MLQPRREWLLRPLRFQVEAGRKEKQLKLRSSQGSPDVEQVPIPIVSNDERSPNAAPRTRALNRALIGLTEIYQRSSQISDLAIFFSLSIIPRPQKNLSNSPDVKCYQTQRAGTNIAEAQVFAVSQRPSRTHTCAPEQTRADQSRRHLRRNPSAIVHVE